MIKKIFYVFFLFLVGFFGGMTSLKLYQPPSLLRIVEKKEIRITENKALKEAIRKVERTVFFVKTQTKTKNVSGCGFVLSSDGLAITLSQLIPASFKTQIFFEGKEVPFQVLKRDQKENLVLLKIEAKDLSSAPFFNFEKLEIGERVFILCSFFENEKFQKFANEGVIKSFNENHLFTNIIEEERSSGAPLFDIEGNFLGISQINKNKEIIVIPVQKIRSFANL
jgi:S1-C subfamily serine protease